VIALAGSSYEAAFGSASPATYLARLRAQGALLTNYTALGTGDLPDYIALVSGQAPNAATEAGCTTYADFPANTKPDGTGYVRGTGCVYPIQTLTLPDQLTSARKSWRAYVEDLASGPGAVKSCRHPDPGAADPTQQARVGDQYAARHNPFIYFHSLLDLGDCATNDVDLGQLNGDLGTTTKTPNLTFLIPNLCHGGGNQPCVDGQPGGLVSADSFLRQWVPLILRSPAYRKDGLLIITFAGPGSGGEIHTGTLLLSRYVRRASTSARPYDAYSLLRSIEDIFGVAHLAGANGTGVGSLTDDVLKTSR
jgi:hypothetical protein